MTTEHSSLTDIATACAITAIEQGLTLDLLHADGADLPAGDLDYAAVQFGRALTRAEKRALWLAFVEAVEARLARSGWVATGEEGVEVRFEEGRPARVSVRSEEGETARETTARAMAGLTSLGWACKRLVGNWEPGEAEGEQVCFLAHPSLWQ